MTTSAFPTNSELKSIMLAFASRRRARAETLNDMVSDALGLPPVAPDDDSAWETEFMTGVEDRAAELAAIRLAAARDDRPFLTVELFAPLVDEYVAKLRNERARNVGTDDPLIANISRNLKGYLADQVAGVVGWYVGSKDDPYVVWSVTIEDLTTLAAERGCSALEIVQTDALYDEYIRRYYEPESYHAAVTEMASYDLRKLTNAESVNQLFGLLDATMGGDGELQKVMRGVISQAEVYFSVMANTFILAYANEQVARIWPTYAP